MMVRFKDFWPRIFLFIQQLHPVLQISNSRQFTAVHTHSGFGDLHRLLKNYHPVCNLPDYFKAPRWADRHVDIHTSHRESRLSPVSYLDKACPLTNICVSLMHEAVISQMHQPPRKVSLGIIAYLRGIKNVLDRLAASLIPRSHFSHCAVLYVRVLAKCTHNISSCQSQVLLCAMFVLCLTLQIS